MNILVTGGTGFVGKGIIARLSAHPTIEITAITRRPTAEWEHGINYVEVPDIAENADWSGALSGKDIVIHAAALAHVAHSSSAEALAEFRRVNTEATIQLAQAAVKAKVKRFIFISSIKVNGETTMPGRPFTADDAPAPHDAYGISKMEAEIALQKIGRDSGMEIVIIRPPLVYGPGVKANFKILIKLAKLGIPLPLGSIHNKRSLVALGNLVDLITVCTKHPAAANQVFLVSDDEDISTTALLKRIAQAMGKPALLFPFPAAILMLAAKLTGRQESAQKLCGSLQVDIEKTRRLLQWHPPVSMQEGLQQTIENL